MPHQDESWQALTSRKRFLHLNCFSAKAILTTHLVEMGASHTALKRLTKRSSMVTITLDDTETTALTIAVRYSAHSTVPEGRKIAAF